MSQDSTRFSVDEEHNTITVQREFSAPRSVLWDAYTRREIIDQWWAPKPWKARTKTIDFKEGGHWLYVMTGPEGEEHWGIVAYRTIEPLKNFTGTDAFANADGVVNQNLPQSEWEVSFTDTDDNSTLVESRITFPDRRQLDDTIDMGFKDGYRIAMDGLEELLISLK